jgi:Ca2+-binding EF-hand superfamily protein
VMELKDVMRSLGMVTPPPPQQKKYTKDPTDEEVRKMIQTADVDRTETIDFDEFLVMMEQFRGEARLQFTDEKLMEAFAAMDFDENGVISTSDLISILKLHGEDLSEKVFAQLMLTIFQIAWT